MMLQRPSYQIERTAMARGNLTQGGLGKWYREEKIKKGRGDNNQITSIGLSPFKTEVSGHTMKAPRSIILPNILSGTAKRLFLEPSENSQVLIS